MKNIRQFLFFIIGISFVFVTTTAFAQAPFQLGDVFAGIANGQIEHYDANGNLLETLSTGLGGYTTGMAFDSAGNLYGTNFTADAISKFTGPNPPHVFSLLANTDPGGDVESMLFDAAGDIYAGQADGTRDILKYDLAGNLLARFDVPTESRGTDWIELAADQRTMFYTSEGNRILRYDLVSGTPLPDFNVAPLPGSNAYALRILPSGGVLVADTDVIVRLDSNGVQIQTYDVSGAGTWFALNIDPDGTSFLSGDIDNGNFYKFDIASGAVLLGPIHTGAAVGNLGGLTVYGEITVAVNNPPICQVTPPGPFTIDENQPLTFTVSATDPDVGNHITLSVSGLPSGATMTPSLPLTGPNTGISSTFDWTPVGGQAGNYSVDFIVTDDSLKADTCTVDITVNPGGIVDITPPSCNLTAVLPGPPKAIEITVQDGESGLNQVMVLKANNATVNIPTITPGTNSPVVVTATKIDNSKGASVALRVVDVAGNATTCDPVYTTISANVPESFDLLQNYPNPFNPTTTIRFAIPSELEGAANVTLKVYDLSGREVKTLISEAVAPGEYSVDWDATNNNGDNVAGGVYLYRLVAGDYTMTKKMTLLK